MIDTSDWFYWFKFCLKADAILADEVKIMRHSPRAGVPPGWRTTGLAHQ